MGIKTTNLIVTGKTTINEKKPETTTADEQKLALAGKTGTKLVVDGKVKNISKKSAYLLDMLTLDDE